MSLEPAQRRLIGRRAQVAVSRRYSRQLTGVVAAVRLIEIEEAWQKAPPRLQRHWGPPGPFETENASQTTTVDVLKAWSNVVPGVADVSEPVRGLQQKLQKSIGESC